MPKTLLKGTISLVVVQIKTGKGITRKGPHVNPYVRKNDYQILFSSPLSVAGKGITRKGPHVNPYVRKNDYQILFSSPLSVACQDKL